MLIKLKRKFNVWLGKKFLYENWLKSSSSTTFNNYLTSEEKEFINKNHKKIFTLRMIEITLFVILLTIIMQVMLYLSSTTQYYIIATTLLFVGLMYNTSKRYKEKFKFNYIKNNLSDIFAMLFAHVITSVFFIPIIISFFIFLKKSKKDKDKIIFEKEIMIDNVFHKVKLNKNHQEFFYNKKGELHREDNNPAIVYYDGKEYSKRTQKYYYMGKEIIQKGKYSKEKQTVIFPDRFQVLYFPELNDFFLKEKNKIRNKIKQEKIKGF